MGAQFGGQAVKSEDLMIMSHTQVMSMIIKYHKEIRKGQTIEQKAMKKREMIDQRRQYRSTVDKARSSATTTAIIRDYHKTVM